MQPVSTERYCAGILSSTGIFARLVDGADLTKCEALRGRCCWYAGYHPDDPQVQVLGDRALLDRWLAATPF